MMILRFSDGINIHTSGPLRNLHLHDGWYVVGEGILIPVGSSQSERKKPLSLMFRDTLVSQQIHLNLTGLAGLWRNGTRDGFADLAGVCKCVRRGTLV